jgi:hypothetical protein
MKDMPVTCRTTVRCAGQFKAGIPTPRQEGFSRFHTLWMQYNLTHEKTKKEDADFPALRLYSYLLTNLMPCTLSYM